MKMLIFGLLICLTVSCVHHARLPAAEISPPAELEKATALAAQLHENMTFNQVSKIIPLVQSDEVPLMEHGGVFYDVPVGRHYYIHLRFQHASEGEAYEKTLLNLPPAVLSNDYELALMNGLNHLKTVKQFNEIYPEAISFISYFTSTNIIQKWNSQAGIYQRYRLTLQLNISIDRTNLDVKGVSEPMIDIDEIGKIVQATNGNSSFIDLARPPYKISKEDWDKIYAAHGDLGVVGIKVTKNKPVLNFDKCMPFKD
jgi:hypothetical protein